MKLKVYGWIGVRSKPGAPYNQRQSREIVAAHSIAEVRGITGMSRRTWEHTGDETGNREELALALSKPGTVFWRPLNSRDSAEWEEAETPEAATARQAAWHRELAEEHARNGNSDGAAIHARIADRLEVSDGH